MSTRVSFADLLKKGAEKDQQKIGEKPKLSVVETKDKPTPPTLPTEPTLPTPPTECTPPTPSIPNKGLPTSPERDFAKVANSIIREAVAQGLFIGKSKQIYDFLYLQTRGAIQPKRTVRITKLNLMRGSDIGSERTLLKNLVHLKSIGFIRIKEFDGQHGGNEYEVFLPEEINATYPTPPTAPHPPYPPQKVGTVPPVESGVGGVRQMHENKATYGDPKTFFKDINTNDDEAFAGFIEKFQSAAQEVTGKRLSKRDGENLEKIADLLVLELKIAAKRTGSISSVPAFLTEVLRRQFFTARQAPPPQQSSAKSSKAKIDTVGKSETGEYEIKPLDAQGREDALKMLREFSSDADFLESFRKWYTKADWDWIIEQLEKDLKTDELEKDLKTD